MKQRVNRKKLLIFSCLIISFLMLEACRKSKIIYDPRTIIYDQKLFDSDRTFIPHTGPGRWDSYVAMNLPFSPVFSIFEQLEEQLSIKLRHRGEAHITVITPVEYWNELKPFLSIQEINDMAKEMSLQKSSFQIQCLGSGQKWFFPWTLEETFYLVVNSPDLVKFRQSVKKRLIQKGGPEHLFSPNDYYPHITIGFSKRDLHESDGVIKNVNSCDKRVKVVMKR